MARRLARLSPVLVVVLGLGGWDAPVGAQSTTTGTTAAVFPAVLLPGKTALIRAKDPEQVAEVRVGVGSRVRRGDLLLQFADAKERVEVKLAEAMLENKISDLDRSRRLHAQGHISEEEMENDVTLVKLAEAEVELARLEVDELSVRAPFDGIVAERYVDPGASVQAGAPLVRVSESSRLKLEVLLPEDMLPWVERSREIRVTVRNPERRFTVPLEPRPVVVDPASGTFLLQVELDNPDERLTPGVSCEIAIERHSID